VNPSEDNPLRIVFAGTPRFAAGILKTLMAQYTVAAVYTQPDRPTGRGRKLGSSAVKVVASEAGIPLYQPDKLDDEQVLRGLRDLKPDILIVVAYGLILPAAVLSIPTFGCINIHASLLPRWRGASPIQHAILAGDKKSGITVIRMDEGLDTGPIIAQAECNIDPRETGASLHDKLASLGARELVRTVREIREGRVTLTPQDDHLATKAPKIAKTQGCLDWGQSALQLDRAIRAYNPWPVAYTFTHNGQRLRIWDAQPLAGPSTADPGAVLRASEEGVDVATGDGVLRILQLQRDGARIVSAAEFIRAFSALMAPGTRLRGA